MSCLKASCPGEVMGGVRNMELIAHMTDASSSCCCWVVSSLRAARREERINLLMSASQNSVGLWIFECSNRLHKIARVLEIQNLCIGLQYHANNQSGFDSKKIMLDPQELGDKLCLFFVLDSNNFHKVGWNVNNAQCLKLDLSRCNCGPWFIIAFILNGRQVTTLPSLAFV